MSRSVAVMDRRLGITGGVAAVLVAGGIALGLALGGSSSASGHGQPSLAPVDATVSQSTSVALPSNGPAPVTVAAPVSAPAATEVHVTKAAVQKPADQSAPAQTEADPASSAPNYYPITPGAPPAPGPSVPASSAQVVPSAGCYDGANQPIPCPSS
jgi:hypothetical protein